MRAAQATEHVSKALFNMPQPKDIRDGDEWSEMAIEDLGAFISAGATIEEAVTQQFNIISVSLERYKPRRPSRCDECEFEPAGRIRQA